MMSEEQKKQVYDMITNAWKLAKVYAEMEMSDPDDYRILIEEANKTVKAVSVKYCKGTKENNLQRALLNDVLDYIDADWREKHEVS